MSQIFWVFYYAELVLTCLNYKYRSERCLLCSFTWKSLLSLLQIHLNIIGIFKSTLLFFFGNMSLQGFIYLIKNRKIAILWNLINKKKICFFIVVILMLYNVICFYDSKAGFSASLLQSSVSHVPSEIIIICWFTAEEKIFIIISVKTRCSLVFLWNHCFFPVFLIN